MTPSAALRVLRRGAIVFSDEVDVSALGDAYCVGAGGRIMLRTAAAVARVDRRRGGRGPMERLAMAQRDAEVRSMLPATTTMIRNRTGIITSTIQKICQRIGAQRIGPRGFLRVWSMDGASPEVRRILADAAERRRLKSRRRWLRAKEAAKAARRARGLYPAARDREARIAAMLPATTHTVAAALGVTVEGARAALRRMGMARVGGEPTPGGGRPRVIWGLPLPSGSDRLGRTKEST